MFSLAFLSLVVGYSFAFGHVCFGHFVCTDIENLYGARGKSGRGVKRVKKGFSRSREKGKGKTKGWIRKKYFHGEGEREEEPRR